MPVRFEYTMTPARPRRGRCEIGEIPWKEVNQNIRVNETKSPKKSQLA